MPGLFRTARFARGIDWAINYHRQLTAATRSFECLYFFFSSTCGAILLSVAYAWK